MFAPGFLGQRWEHLVRVMQDIAAGMAYMHAKRICHGDLNPSNVLLKVRPACFSSLVFRRPFLVAPALLRRPLPPRSVRAGAKLGNGGPMTVY